MKKDPQISWSDLNLKIWQLEEDTIQSIKRIIESDYTNKIKLVGRVISEHDSKKYLLEKDTIGLLQ